MTHPGNVHNMGPTWSGTSDVKPTLNHSVWKQAVDLYLANTNTLFCDVDVEEQLRTSGIALSGLYAVDRM